MPLYLPKKFAGDTLLHVEEIYPEILVELFWDEKLKPITYAGREIVFEQSYCVLLNLKDTIIYHIQQARNNRYHDRVSVMNALRLWEYLIYSEHRFSLWHPPETDVNAVDYWKYHALNIHADIWDVIWSPLTKATVSSELKARTLQVAGEFLRYFILRHPCRKFACEQQKRYPCMRCEGCCKAETACWGKHGRSYSICEQKNCGPAPHPAWLAGLAKSLHGIDSSHYNGVCDLFVLFFKEQMKDGDSTSQADTARLLSWFIWADALQECGAAQNFTNTVTNATILDVTFEAFENLDIALLHKFPYYLALAHRTALAVIRKIPPPTLSEEAAKDYIKFRREILPMNDFARMRKMNSLIGKTVSVGG